MHLTGTSIFLLSIFLSFFKFDNSYIKKKNSMNMNTKSLFRTCIELVFAQLYCIVSNIYTRILYLYNNFLQVLKNTLFTVNQNIIQSTIRICTFIYPNLTIIYHITLITLMILITISRTECYLTLITCLFIVYYYQKKKTVKMYCNSLNPT